MSFAMHLPTVCALSLFSKGHDYPRCRNPYHEFAEIRKLKYFLVL